MADFDITSPDGRKFRVTAPDGATQDQVLAYAQEQFAKMPKEEPGLLKKMTTGYVAGGPMGATAAAVAEGGKALDRAAYDAGGYVTDTLSSGKRSPFNPLGIKAPAEVAAGAGYAANVGLQAIPAVLSGGPAKSAAPAFEAAARGAMQQALKPTYAQLQSGEAAKAITTMLERGINATEGGVNLLRQQIDLLNRKVLSAIQSSTESIDKVKVANELQKTLAKFEKQVTPGADVRAIETAWEEFLNHPLVSGKLIPVQLAQELKQGTYRILASKYGEQGSAATEAQKALARGLKEGISEKVPAVAGLNAEESKLINALEVAERRALMDGNKNLTGLGLLTHSPGAFAAFMADKSALFKSLVARMMHSGAEQIPATAARTGTAAVEMGSNR